jgi:hypothetical protein
MTQDEIIEIVMQIGECDRPEDDSPALKMFVAFAKLVAAKERERIHKAKECCILCKQKGVCNQNTKDDEANTAKILGKS